MKIIDQFNILRHDMEQWAQYSKQALAAAISAETARQEMNKSLIEFLESLAHPEHTLDELAQKLKEKLHL